MNRRAVLIAALQAVIGATLALPSPAMADAARPAGTLLVGNKGEDSVSFIDLATARELGRVPTGRMPHEIAISPDGRQAAVVHYGAASIDIFDVATRARVRRIDLSPNVGPHGLIWLPDGRIIATTERSQSLTIVDTNNGDRIRSIPTGQRTTHMVVVSGDGRRAYTANIGSGNVSVIDLVAGAVTRHLDVGGEPEGIALSPDGQTLWVADKQAARVIALSTATLERVGETATGAVPIRILASPDGRFAVTSNYGAGTLTVIDARTRAVTRTIEVSGEPAAQQVTILFSADGNRLYVAETGRNQVAEVDMATGRVLRRLAAGRNGDGLAIAPPH